MLLAKIVKSNSHVDYVGRVVDTLDAANAPQAEDYGFAQFVALPTKDERVIGVVYNTLLLNPEYGNFGPRLSSRDELAVLSPDYLNEQGVLIGVLLIGWEDSGGAFHHGVPRRVVPVGCEVEGLNTSEVHRFHSDKRGQLQLHYYSHAINHAGTFGVPLVEAIIEQLERTASEADKQRLCVLKKSLAWQRTINVVRL